MWAGPSRSGCDRHTLERAQQLGLHRQAQIADFIQKERAAASSLEATRTVLARIREGPATMSEQL